MGYFAEYSGRILKLILFGVIAVTALAVLTYVVIEHDKTTLINNGVNPKQTTLHATGAGSADPTLPSFLVPGSRIPQTQSQRATAPAITLVAGDWQTDPDPSSGPGYDQASIPLADRTLLSDDVQSFLTAWETFSPPGEASQNTTAAATYTAGVEPWTDPADLAAVVGRDDNRQPADICPGPGCSTGSTWAAGDVWRLMNVRYYTPAQAYVTVSGFVRYTDVSGQDGLNGTVWERSYGLLLERLTNRWLVERAAADTIRQVS